MRKLVKSIQIVLIMISFERLIQDKKNSLQQVSTKSSPSNGNFNLNLHQMKMKIEYWKMRDESDETAETLHKLIQITRQKRKFLDQKTDVDNEMRKQILLYNFHKKVHERLDKFTEIRKRQRTSQKLAYIRNICKNCQIFEKEFQNSGISVSYTCTCGSTVDYDKREKEVLNSVVQNNSVSVEKRKRPNILRRSSKTINTSG